MTKCWLLTMTLAIALSTGCSGSVSTPTAAAVQVGSNALAAALPSLPGGTASSSALPTEPSPPRGVSNGADAALPTAAPARASPFPEIGDLFAPPKVVIPAVTKELGPEPVVNETMQEKQIPQLRLIGFVELEGLKALLSVEGKLNVLTIGESAEGFQIIAIEPPAVTLKYGTEGEEFQMNLYDQPWFHPPGAFSSERNSSGGKPVIPMGSSNRSMPGFPGGAKAPGIGVPAVSGATNSAYAPSAVPSNPGIGGANDPPGIPGLAGAIGAPGGNTSASNKNAGTGSKNSQGSNNTNRGMPGMPSLPGVGGLPGGSVQGAAPTK